MNTSDPNNRFAAGGSTVTLVRSLENQLIHHEKLFGEWAYHTRLLELKALDMITADEMRSLIKQLNSIDEEAVLLAQTTINNLIKEL